MNSIHLVAGSTFDVSAAGLQKAIMLLDLSTRDGMAAPGVDMTDPKHSFAVINFRSASPNSVGDFSPASVPPYQDLYFPFTAQGIPAGDNFRFATRVRAYFNINTPGIYTFAMRGVSLAHLEIGKISILDATSEMDVQKRQVQFEATGLYPIELVQFQNSGPAQLELSRAFGALDETPTQSLMPFAQYKLFSQEDLYSAVKGSGTCQECDPNRIPTLCSTAYYCRANAGLCEPCILPEHCGPTCLPCPGDRPICNAPNDNPQTATCVQCVTSSDCKSAPGGVCNNMGTCIYPCTGDTQCKSGQVCERDAGVCVPECSANRMCPNGTCNLDAGVCVSDCKVDTDCPIAGQYCQSGVCSSCPTGMAAIPRTPEEVTAKVPPKCGKPSYRGGCSATGAGSASSGAGALMLLGLGLLGLGLRRRRTALLGAAGAGAFFLLASSPAVAQTTPVSINAQTLQPAFGPYNFLTVDGSRTPGKTTFLFNALLEYARNPLRYVVTDSMGVMHTVDETIPHMAVLHLQAGVGIGRWAQVGAELPILYQALGKPTPEIPTLPNNWGLGDLRLLAKFRILNNEWEGVGLAFAPQITIPLPLDGSFDKVGQTLHSAGTVGLEPRVVLDYHFRWGLQLGLNLGFLAYIDPNKQHIQDVVLVSHQVRYGLGGFIPLSKVVGLWGELFGSASIDADPKGRRYAPLEALVGVRIFNDSGLVVNLGIGSGFLGDVGSAQIRALLSIGYLPGYLDPDIDKDGVLNEVDRCPRVPGPKENQGCPDEDYDKDGIINRLDKCPYEAGPKENGGCPDKDTDGDGIIDRLDKCPLLWGPKENDGCPDKDTDGDGTVDRLDKCPTVPGPKANQGCPWPDTDKDGIIDPEDKCPLEPGPKENDGCPDKDTDGDGIVDRLDKCPLVPGVPPTGCPERKFIVVTQEKIELKQKIFFATNKSKILPPSYDLLNEVVAVLKERTTMRLRIEGHTDIRGTLQWNMELSRARADSVRQYLIDAGIDAGRLTSEGYGPTKPIGDNKTDEGREKNRRTEFFIVEQ